VKKLHFEELNIAMADIVRVS